MQILWKDTKILHCMRTHESGGPNKSKDVKLEQEFKFQGVFTIYKKTPEISVGM